MDLKKADGTVLKVATSYVFFVDAQPPPRWVFWSDGNGDWLLEDAKGLDTYFRKLFEDEIQSAKQGKK